MAKFCPLEYTSLRNLDDGRNRLGFLLLNATVLISNPQALISRFTEGANAAARKR